MGLRMRKSISLGGGVRMNVSRRSVGLSAGAPGARYSINSSGRRTRTLGVPGTGVSHVSSSGGGRRASPAKAGSTREAQAPERQSPGMLAPKYEKEFHKGVEALIAGDAAGAREHFLESSRRDERDRAIGDDLMAGLVCMAAEDNQAAIEHLEKVVASDIELPDELVAKYAGPVVLGIKVTPHVRIELGPSSMAAVLGLVECYQDEGRLDEAIGLLQRLLETDPGSPELTLSLCELLHQEGSWQELVELGAGVENVDDVTFSVRLFQAEALSETGQSEAALEVFRGLLRTKKRTPELLQEARYGRGTTLIALGKVAQGRKDLAAIYADDPAFRDVATLLS